MSEGSTVTVFIDGRPSTRWSLRIREQSHLVIPSTHQDQRVVVGFGPSQCCAMVCDDNLGGGGGQEISMDPLVFGIWR